MKNIIVLMTALIPTTGHTDLINFAANIPESRIYVLVNGRVFEPVETSLRVESLKEHFRSFDNIVVKGSVIDDAPQNPESMPEGFWEWWRGEINNNFPEVQQDWNYVVASESYGLNVAKSLGADFLPYDIQRELNPTRGTDVRNNIFDNWENIIQEFRKHISLNAVIFGQESVGKTTLSKTVAQRFNTFSVMEFARPYLEEVGSELSIEKMNNICLGQAGLQKSVQELAKSPINVFDTDLFSTVGYYRIYDGKETDLCQKLAKELASDVYYVLPDTIPFVEDELRYGGSVRESDKQFWINILEEFGLNYVLVPDGSVQEKTDFITFDIIERFTNKLQNIKEFERE